MNCSPTEQQTALMCCPSELQRDVALCQLGARTSDKEMTVIVMHIIPCEQFFFFFFWTTFQSSFPLFSKSTNNAGDLYCVGVMVHVPVRTSAHKTKRSGTLQGLKEKLLVEWSLNKEHTAFLANKDSHKNTS